MAKKKGGWGYLLVFIVSIIILSNNVIQFSEFLLNYQELVIIVLFMSALAYMILRDRGYEI